ncbi:MAG: bifunctional heptose 7-phosphate kinase/heptose 1-phosphate adenyltransferase [Planctomycetaceae bacterium]
MPQMPVRLPDLDTWLARLPAVRCAVLGDLFLDRYLDLDARLTEISIETALEAFQVTRTRCYPGAAGTVLNNLVALGVGQLSAISVVGDDGEAFELRRELRARGVDLQGVLSRPDRQTPTYTKPMLNTPGHPPRELNRLDIKNRGPGPAQIDQAVIAELERQAPTLDALIIADQVSERNCGVVTDAVREAIAAVAERFPRLIILADSRSHIGLFRHCLVKPNRAELARAVGEPVQTEEALDLARVPALSARLAEQTGREVLTTLGPNGVWLSAGGGSRHVPGVQITGPIDVVGAGDSTTAGIVAALCGGASLPEAASVGCLVASLTIQQLGVTGVATPDQVRQRLREAEWSGPLASLASGHASHGTP